METPTQSVKKFKKSVVQNWISSIFLVWIFLISLVQNKQIHHGWLMRFVDYISFQAKGDRLPTAANATATKKPAAKKATKPGEFLYQKVLP